jgi:hypothetical protein
MSDASTNPPPEGPAKPFSLIFCIALMAGLCDVFCAPVLRRGEPSLFLAAAIAFVLAQVGLTAIWLAFGWLALALRVLAAAGMVACIPSAPGGARAFVWAFSAILFAAVPCAIARLSGCQIRQFADLAAKEKWLAGVRPTQFTLRQMFSWTTVAAILVALARLAERQNLVDLRDLIGDGVFAIAAGVFLLSVVWATLRERSQARGVALISVGTLIFGMLLAVLMGVDARDAAMIVLTLPLTVLLLSGLLLIFRANGFRYVRARRRI